MNAVMEPPQAKTLSIQAQIDSWTSEQRELVFLTLLDEILALNPVEAIIPIEGGDGIDRGHLVTPKGVRGYFEKYGPKLTTAQVRSERDLFGTGPTISWDEAMAILNEAPENQHS